MIGQLKFGSDGVIRDKAGGRSMSERKRTLEDVRRMTEDVLTPGIVAEVIGCSGHTLGVIAHEEPEKLPFPSLCIGRNTYFPRSGFINWMDGMTKNDFWKDRYFKEEEA